MYDVIIIGSGPAGCTASIYLARNSLKTLLVAGYKSGGQLMLTTYVENFPGFKSILGPELMNRMKEQVISLGVEVIEKDATSVDFSLYPFKVFVDDKVFEGKRILIATGARPKLLNVDGEKELIGRGVSTCATCDAPFFKDKYVLVIGGGDTAMEYALTLAKFSREVTIVHRREEFKASKIMLERVKANEKIKFKVPFLVEKIIGKEKVEAVLLKNLKSEEKEMLRCDGVFLAIGHVPNTEIFKGILEMDEKGYIKVDSRFQTSIKGVFAAGDCVDSKYRQAITAAGDGCKAALEIVHELSEL
ncbi:MAG: thioredoxin-disulfide reductase [Candidatus Aenigmarchaeota archaeon]|nr:thioredoxin-disulfide reductase [Candidatus Aenigmarchaeota archaeon]MDW8149504.1 thioredoxin-disulfide reductase [Candidatus Aenigmarchaeota archaeon]